MAIYAILETWGKLATNLSIATALQVISVMASANLGDTAAVDATNAAAKAAGAESLFRWVGLWPFWPRANLF